MDVKQCDCLKNCLCMAVTPTPEELAASKWHQSRFYKKGNVQLWGFGSHFFIKEAKNERHVKNSRQLL
jgi:hypothetical protein